MGAASCCLLCGKFLQCFIGIGKPDFVDVMQHVLVRSVVVFTIALQHLMILQRIFHRDKRRIRMLFSPDKEDE